MFYATIHRSSPSGKQIKGRASILHFLRGLTTLSVNSGLGFTKDGRPAAPGERGEVVLTALHSFAMPFIRFRLGDIVTKGDSHCACGQPFATIRSVQGRMFDYFPLPDGRLVHPYEIIAILSEQLHGFANISSLRNGRTSLFCPSFRLPHPHRERSGAYRRPSQRFSASRWFSPSK